MIAKQVTEICGVRDSAYLDDDGFSPFGNVLLPNMSSKRECTAFLRTLTAVYMTADELHRLTGMYDFVELGELFKKYDVWYSYYPGYDYYVIVDDENWDNLKKKEGKWL